MSYWTIAMFMLIITSIFVIIGFLRDREASTSWTYVAAYGGNSGVALGHLLPPSVTATCFAAWAVGSVALAVVAFAPKAGPR